MYKLIKTKDKNNRHSLADVEMTLPDEVTSGQLLEEFANFLRACGFVIKGELVEEEPLDDRES